LIILKVFFSFIISFLVALSKRTFTKKSGVVTSNIDKRYNPINQEEQDSSSSSDDLKTMTEVCDQILCIYIQKHIIQYIKTKRRVKWVDSDSTSCLVMSVLIYDEREKYAENKDNNNQKSL
jgi:hypothetical protein